MGFPLVAGSLVGWVLDRTPEAETNVKDSERSGELCGRAADIECKKGGNHRVNYPAADDRNQVVLPCNESSTRK